MLEQVELEQGRQLIKARGKPPGVEQVALKEAHGRVLADMLRSPMDQPPYNRSPLDGYALKAGDTAGASPGSPVTLEIIDKVYAGGVSRKKVTSGFALRLMTGSAIPEGADCIMRQEDTEAEGRRVKIYKELTPWDNYCFRGENLKKGDPVLLKDSLLKAAEIGVLAGLGITTAAVYQNPTAAVISTGDELVEPGLELGPGKVYNGNYYAITCRLKECGINVVPTTILGDDRRIIEECIAGMIEKVDFIITTGGVSVGEKDLILETMSRLGAEKVFWKVNMKPGSPALFCILKGKPVISLSGNPLAAAVTFDLLLYPFLVKITGKKSLEFKTTRAILQNDFNKASPIRRMIRGLFSLSEDGEAVVEIRDWEQSPGNLKSMLSGNCYIDVEKGSPGLKRGEPVKIII